MFVCYYLGNFFITLSNYFFYLMWSLNKFLIQLLLIFSVVEVFVQNMRVRNEPPKKYPMSEAERILYQVLLLRYL